MRAHRARWARATAKTSAALAALTVISPVTAAVTATALVAGRRPRRTGGEAAPPKTILVSGGKMTKALALARAFHRAGHRVVLVESARYRLTGHRFSRAVDAFHVVPEPGASGYAQALLEIVRAEGVDVFVPVSSPASSLPDAHARRVLEPHCEVLHGDPETIARLDDKAAFAELAASLGLPVPDAHRITDPRQVLDFAFPADGRRYILKSIAYDPVRRLDLTRLPRATPAETAAFVAALPISEANPWVLQEFVTGREFCTHSMVRSGAVQLHGCCASSAFQVNYAMAHVPEIDAWVRRFVGALGLTGQVSFDFIQAPDGSVRAIECNPRTHSAVTMFHDHPGVARAYLEDGAPEIQPLPASRPTYWLFHELWRLVRHPATAALRVRTIARGKEAIFDASDPLPFLLVHHLQLPRLLLGGLRHGRAWIRMDFNIGKLVEAGGD